VCRKVLNLFSSLVATTVFAVRGLIDWKLGMILGATSFTGALAGAAFARNLSNHTLRRIFLVAVLALAAKTLLLLSRITGIPSDRKTLPQGV
jgi:uncharacterized protein